MHSASRRGLSLIEVVAAIALLGSLLAATMTARSRLLRQQHKAEQMNVAIREVRSLVDTWLQDPPSAVLEGEGVFGEEATLAWRSTSRPAEIPGIEVAIVHLVVFGNSASADDLDEAPLVEVEFLLNAPNESADNFGEPAP